MSVSNIPLIESLGDSCQDFGGAGADIPNLQAGLAVNGIQMTRAPEMTVDTSAQNTFTDLIGKGPSVSPFKLG